MYRFKKNQYAAGGFLAAIIMIIGVMIAIIISSMILFPFADAGQTVNEHTETFTISDNSTDEHFNLSHTPGSTPEFVIHLYNSSSAAWILQASANYTVVSGNHLYIESAHMGSMSGYTQIRTSYNSIGHSSVGDVITYAIIVFTMMAIVPLIIVGGLMLSSLGFFGGSGKP